MPPGPRSCQLARYPRTTPAISTASLPVLARRFRADPHEVGRIEGLGLDSWELVAASTRASDRQPVTPAIRRPGPAWPPAGHCRHNQQSGELVDQGQQIEVSAGHEPEDVAPVSSSTRASDASDARRSHRSVEGDEKPHGVRERERHTAKNPRYYIRAFEFTAISGLGRFGGRGGGLARDFEHHHHVVHLGLGRARWPGAQGLPPPFRRPLCPSWRAGFSPTPTKSGASRASG